MPLRLVRLEDSVYPIFGVTDSCRETQLAGTLPAVTRATAIGAHILDAFTQATYVAGQTVALGISIGIAELDAAVTPISAAAFLHRADEAMYRAKRTAKGSAITWTQDPAADPATTTSPTDNEDTALALT